MNFIESILGGENACTSEARLAAVNETGPQHLGDGQIQIGVIKDDAGSFAAQFEGHALHRLHRGGENCSVGGGRKFK